MLVEPSEWTEVEVTSRRGAVVRRWIAGMLAVTGVAAVAVAFLMTPDWWAVVAMGLTGVFLVIIGISLWFNTGSNADATVALLKTGTPVSLRVLRGDQIHDDSVVYRLLLRLPTTELVTVQHQCSWGQCVDAGRSAPNTEVPAIFDPATKTWGIVHGGLARLSDWGGL